MGQKKISTERVIAMASAEGDKKAEIAAAPGGEGEIFDLIAPTPRPQPRIELYPYDPIRQRAYVKLTVTVGIGFRIPCNEL